MFYKQQYEERGGAVPSTSHSEQDTMDISVVVAVYNSERSLRPLVERLKPVLEKAANAFELILVNDGSQDNSWGVVCELAEAHDWIHGINLMRNYGQHNALLCGILRARYGTILSMDDDLQHPPEEIPKLVACYEEGCDVVYGAPARETHGILRDLASAITKYVLKGAMGVDAARHVSQFRLFRTYIRDSFRDFSGEFVNIDVLLTWGTSQFGVVKVQHDERTIGQSNYTFRKLMSHAVNMVTGFSVRPLQMASLVGFGFALFGLLVLAYAIGSFLILGRVVPGFIFTICVITIFAGAQLFSLGIIGEYLARMFSRSMNRPSFFIRQEIGKQPKVKS